MIMFLVISQGCRKSAPREGHLSEFSSLEPKANVNARSNKVQLYKKIYQINVVVNILHCYRVNCASTTSYGQLILPESLKLLPLYLSCIFKQGAFRRWNTLCRVDQRFAEMLRFVGGNSHDIYLFFIGEDTGVLVKYISFSDHFLFVMIKQVVYLTQAPPSTLDCTMCWILGCMPDMEHRLELKTMLTFRRPFSIRI